MSETGFEDDFVLSDGPGFRAALCSKCGAIKPIAEFQRRMSKAYAQSRGKVGGVGMVVASSMCRSCQPKPKPVSLLTAKELHNKVQTGDVHEAIATTVLEKRHAKARAKSRSAVQNAWDTKRMAYWQPMIDAARAERRRVQQQEKYAAHTLGLDPELLTFFVEYKTLLTTTVARMQHAQRTKMRKEDGPPPHKDWQGFVDPTDWQKIRTLWLAMPFTYRTGAKTPTLLDTHPVDVQPYVPENKTLRKGPSAAERLGLKGEKK